MAESLFASLEDGRRQFLALVADVRPDLHRYCARMTGSVADGEDVVQDTLARAYYELSELKEVPPLRPWLFRIAHNRAVDYLRRYERKMSEPLDAALEIPADDGLDPEDALARDQAVRAAVSRFLELAPAQRSCVILKDVLDHSLDEIAALLALSMPAVKAALNRGRARLRELGKASDPAAPPRPVPPALARYAALFNARDWDGVRAMLVDDVKLDLGIALEARGATRGRRLLHELRRPARLAPRPGMARRPRGHRGPARCAARLLHGADAGRRPGGRDPRLSLRAVHPAGSGNRASQGGQVMKTTMVRYKVKADRASENERYVAKVFEQLRRNRPAGLRYVSFKLNDGVSFVHIVSLEAADGTNPLRESAAFEAFTAHIRDRCAEPPVAVDLTEVGSYGFFGE